MGTIWARNGHSNFCYRMFDYQSYDLKSEIGAPFPTCLGTGLKIFQFHMAAQCVLEVYPVLKHPRMQILLANPL